MKGNRIQLLGDAQKQIPPEGGGVIMLAVNVPPHLAERVNKHQLLPRELVLEPVAAGGLLTAGQPVMLPVRELSPLDIIVMMQRAIEHGRVVPSIIFAMPEQQQGEKPNGNPPKGA